MLSAKRGMAMRPIRQVVAMMWRRAGVGSRGARDHGRRSGLCPGFIPNPYTAQCLAPVSTPIINGQPCIASNIGLCSSFVQNQQPRAGCVRSAEAGRQESR